MVKNKGLGKGLGALFTEADYIVESNDSKVNKIRISDIEPDRDQPRKIFNEETLTSLAESIERHGILQPLVVRKVKNSDSDSAASKLLGDKYTIISGERRWRAAKMAGLTEVPVVIKDLSDTDVAAIMLVENLQREDLNPVELAEGLKRLIEEFGLTQEEAASIVGISRPALTNSLRLLTLPDEALDTLANGDISAGHARALLGFAKKEDMIATANLIIKEDISVRQIEALVKESKKAPSKPKEQKKRDKFFSEVELALVDNLGRKVKIKENGKKGSGVLEIEFFDRGDLESLALQLENYGK